MDAPIPDLPPGVAHQMPTPMFDGVVRRAYRLDPFYDWRTEICGVPAIFHVQFLILSTSGRPPETKVLVGRRGVVPSLDTEAVFEHPEFQEIAVHPGGFARAILLDAGYGTIVGLDSKILWIGDNSEQES